MLKVRNWERTGGFHRIVREGDEEEVSCVKRKASSMSHTGPLGVGHRESSPV